jgi:hypothetical protein
MIGNRFTPLGLLQHVKKKRAVYDEDDDLFYKSIERSRKRRKGFQHQSEKKENEIFKFHRIIITVKKRKSQFLKIGNFD